MKSIMLLLAKTAARLRTSRPYLPLLALAVGFISAFIAYFFSPLFVLLPIWAFVFGYYSSWWSGLLKGFLLFLGYTVATQLMSQEIINLFYPLPYLYSFIFGGFVICIIGGLAPLVRKGIRRPASVAVLLCLAAIVAWCGYLALPRYSYYYQIIINSSENLEGLEIYLPLATISGDPYLELYDNAWEKPGLLTRDFTKEIVDTEYGQMLKLTVPWLMASPHPDYPYLVNIIFRQREDTPQQIVHLMPKYDVVPINTLNWGPFSLGNIRGRETIESFNVPILIKTATEAEIRFRLENRTSRSEAINFAFGKYKGYTELITFKGTTGGGWLMVFVEVTTSY